MLKDVSDVLDGDRKALRCFRHRERDVEPRRAVININMGRSQTQKLHRRRFGKIEIKKRDLRNRIAARVLYRLQLLNQFAERDFLMRKRSDTCILLAFDQLTEGRIT